LLTSKERHLHLDKPYLEPPGGGASGSWPLALSDACPCSGTVPNPQTAQRPDLEAFAFYEAIPPTSWPHADLKIL
jgi:hypothetical protein